MRFSVIVVCLNPGTKLQTTMDSILGQTYRDFEVIIKDGGSTDGSVDALFRREASSGVWNEGCMAPLRDVVRFFQEKDSGIYDAMNQAVAHAAGEFVLFLNCGDKFADEKVLERTAALIDTEVAAGADQKRLVLYGDTYSEKNGVIIKSPPVITGFACYRNIPCHQSCFYSNALCRGKSYDLDYRIRADYDHFLWCYYRGGARFVYMGFLIASYEGGGYSESKGNRRRDEEEHRMITMGYMKKRDLFRYRAFMICTLAPLRSALAESRMFSGLYHRLKSRIYQG